jgi:ATP-dependent DNA helicase RecG
MPSKDKAAVRDAVASGAANVLVGTQALIQDGVEFERLGLSIVDEQHRFGVMQRAELRPTGGDGAVPHQMVMTATPIPRTLALVLNADMDHSVLDELPPGRQPVKTLRLTSRERERAYQYIRHEVARGRRAFVVCPLVEASEDVRAPAAESEYERLTRDVYPDLRVGLIHGQLTPQEKERAMASFRDGGLDVLVATTVIEVGVDVPEATVLLVEGADRFGLAQLHQLRGRVGRGEGGGACILVADDASEAATRRLDALTSTTNGMELADLDLQMRGPGDYFGIRQAGAPDTFAFARGAPLEVMAQAGRIAARILDADPGLARPEHAALR